MSSELLADADTISPRTPVELNSTGLLTPTENRTTCCGSTCDGTVDQSSDDQEFFDVLLASGAQLLAGAGQAPAFLSASHRQSRLGRTPDYFTISLVSLFTSVPNS